MRMDGSSGSAESLPSEPPPVGGFVELDGRRLWTLAAGAGGRPVVMLPGAGGVGLDFLLVHERVAAFTTSVLYDRAGTGWSDDAALPRSADAVTDELRALLRATAPPAPYVLIGHSLGGVYAQRYAQRFPDEAAALLLLEPAHEDWDDYMPEHLRLAANQVPDGAMPALTGDQLAQIRASFERTFAAFPAPLRELLIDRHLSPERLPTGFREGLNVLAVLDELRSGGPRPDVPLTVLSGTEPDAGQLVFAPEAMLREQIAAAERLFAAIASDTPRGEHHVLAGASHVDLPMVRAEAVAEAVRALLGRA